MINESEIKKAIRTVKDFVGTDGIETSKAIGVVLNLAEQVLQENEEKRIMKLESDCWKEILWHYHKFLTVSQREDKFWVLATKLQKVYLKELQTYQNSTGSGDESIHPELLKD